MVKFLIKININYALKKQDIKFFLKGNLIIIRIIILSLLLTILGLFTLIKTHL